LSEYLLILAFGGLINQDYVIFIFRLDCTVSADNSVVSDISVTDDSFKLTYLEVSF
jgi:hypothetical protein